MLRMGDLQEVSCRLVVSAQPTGLRRGMSHDYAVAVEEGSTIVRVGSAIFGRRDYGQA